MFNADDYNDNIGYCEYVWLKNIELNLELSTATEIQFIANKYLDEVISRRGFDEEEVYENDKILLSVVEKHAKKLNKFRTLKHLDDEKNVFASSNYTPNEKALDEEISINLANDKELSRFGGYGYNDDFDDHGLDEDAEEIHYR